MYKGVIYRIALVVTLILYIKTLCHLLKLVAWLSFVYIKNTMQYELSNYCGQK